MPETPRRPDRGRSRNRGGGAWLLASFLLLGACSTPGAADAPPASQPPAAAPGAEYTNADWWPNRLDLSVLHQNPPAGNPMGVGFDYAAEFAKVDLAELKKDVESVLTTSQDWWPADYGHYGGLMIRLAWHSAGTYRVTDGRGGSGSGTIRFAPLNSWPDNANLDKARRLLWPVKRKYGSRVSWADLIVLSGNVALESMGLKTFGFAGGREDVWEPESGVYWGRERRWLEDRRHAGGELEHPLAASQMGLIYVNPEGPGGKPDPVAAAAAIRMTFSRMGMDNEETVALIAGGHTLGKAHGAAEPGGHVGPEPEAAPIEEQGFGWRCSYGKGRAEDTITSGLEGAWTFTPDHWSHDFFGNLFGYEWKLTRSPAGAWQWTPTEPVSGVPDAHVRGRTHAPMMLTTDMALRMDPVFEPISRRFLEDPASFDAAFARAWYKLTHRDLGPHGRLLGPEVPPPQIWQDPVPPVDHELIDGADVSGLKAKIIGSGLTVQDLVAAAWASASTYRGSDHRGGSNGGRVRLAPQSGWEANEPERLARVLGVIEGIRREFNGSQSGRKRVSMADLIVLGGCAALERAAADAGYSVSVPFTPGRTDATEAMTDAASFAVLEPVADGFRNYAGARADLPAPELLVDRAQLLTLSAPEMTVLVGGMRALNANFRGSSHGVFTDRPGALSNDFFVNLLDMGTAWTASKSAAGVYEGRDRRTGEIRWTGTDVDLVFGSNSQLRAIAEVYACDDARRKFVDDFIAAWTRVMNLGLRRGG
ncbi:MAG: catalase/peroxidase HPI [Planctomycetaceae bacterium]|nr:catalase/peroxidase HPI [Planctomycetaceae bacterium]